MPLPIIADVFRVALSWTYTGQHAVNVLHFHSVVTTKDAGQLFYDLDNTVTSNMWASVSNSAQIDEVEIIPLDGVSPTQVFPTGAPARWKGGPASQPIPQVAAIISLRTAIRGPRGRGRVFLPFTAESVTEGGFVAGAYTSDLQTGWEDLRTGMDALNWHLGVASYAHDDFEACTGVFPRAATGTQRRRQDRNQP